MPVESLKRVALPFLLCAVSGCGGFGSGAEPPLIPVKGKITYNGKPLTKGTVRFEPDGFGRPAYAQIQSDGTFVLTSVKQADGAVEGHHRVSVKDVDAKLAKIKSLKKYAFPSSSQLTADVSPENREFVFDLK
jgi:hypothetical protein